MQAEFLGKKGEYVWFRKDDGSRYLYPYAKLSETDRARVDALPADSAASDDLTAALPATSERPGEIALALAGKLVVPKGKTLAPVPRDQLNGTRFFAFYYSAKWCPPCRAFTPELVETYAKLKASNPEFELIFVSSDQDADAMKEYMESYNMSWPALRFDQKKTARVVRRPDNERGIPNLVFMNADGKELSVSYTKDGDYRGPQAVLADIRKHFQL
jgi:nucleoredoxin